MASELDQIGGLPIRPVEICHVKRAKAKFDEIAKWICDPYCAIFRVLDFVVEFNAKFSTQRLYNTEINLSLGVGI